MQVYVVRKCPLRGRSLFVCWNITRVSLWLLCNVHFVRGINNVLKLGVIDAPMLTRVWQELEYRIDVCRVTGGAHIEHL